MSSLGHEKLLNRYRFDITLTAESPLRISSGRASNVTDAPVMRDASNCPYVPGSSIRGALRSELERLITGAQPPGLRSLRLQPVAARGSCHPEGDLRSTWNLMAAKGNTRSARAATAGFSTYIVRSLPNLARLSARWGR